MDALQDKYYYYHNYKRITASVSIWWQQGTVCPSVHIWIPFIKSLHTHTQHHFTRHQTLTKSLFSAACWHSNSRLTKSHAGRILITASQSQSCMWNCYLHMRGKGFHPAHCLHTHPATRGGAFGCNFEWMLVQRSFKGAVKVVVKRHIWVVDSWAALPQHIKTHTSSSLHLLFKCQAAWSDCGGMAVDPMKVSERHTGLIRSYFFKALLRSSGM